MKRIRKSCSCDLYPKIKVISFNTIAIPILRLTFNIIRWIKGELGQLDVKTSKILSCKGSFHINSDIDRLHTRHDKGGRRLNRIAEVYIARIISISTQLIEKSRSNKSLNLELNHDQPSLIWPANELKMFNIHSNDIHSKENTLNIKNQIKSNHHEYWFKNRSVAICLDYMITSQTRMRN